MVTRRASLPSVTLASAPDGTSVPLRRGRGPAIVLTPHSADCAECAAYAGRLAAASAELGDWGARLLVVLHADLATASRWGSEIAPGAQVLADPDGRASESPGLAIADEWGEVYSAVETGAQHEFPSVAEVADWLRFIAIQCPECEGPEGDWRSL